MYILFTYFHFNKWQSYVIFINFTVWMFKASLKLILTKDYLLNILHVPSNSVQCCRLEQKLMVFFLCLTISSSSEVLINTSVIKYWSYVNRSDLKFQIHLVYLRDWQKKAMKIIMTGDIRDFHRFGIITSRYKSPKMYWQP